MMTNAHIINIFRLLTKSIFFQKYLVLFSPFERFGISSFLTPINILTLSSKYPVCTNFLRSHLTKKTMIIKVEMILIISTVAKPLTLLWPKTNKTKAAIKVVIFASIIVPKEALFPFS